MKTHTQEAEDVEINTPRSAHNVYNDPDVVLYYGLPYVRLDPEYARTLCWSNNPDDLALQTYFNPEEPNLDTNYNIQGLVPVLREDEGLYRFVLKDKKGRFYIWDEDGHLLWVKSKKIEELASNEDKIEFVICSLGCLDVEPVYRDYHPAEDYVNLEEMRAKRSKYRL